MPFNVIIKLNDNDNDSNTQMNVIVLEKLLNLITLINFLIVIIRLILSDSFFPKVIRLSSFLSTILSSFVYCYHYRCHSVIIKLNDSLMDT